MKFILSLIAILLLGSFPVAASDAAFAEAQQAYDDGEYAKASLLYKTMLNSGVSNFEVEYNLANACFKNSDLPQAVFHYRRAWYESPRDPDIKANMYYALNAAGAAEPKMNLTQQAFSLFSKVAWIKVAVAAYIVFTLLLLAGMVIRPAKRMLYKSSLIPATVILIAAGGWWHWYQLQQNPEWVVIKSGATALYGPMAGSTEHYNLPLAAIVRQKSADSKGWIEIEYDGKNGWLKQEYILRVSP